MAFLEIPFVFTQSGYVPYGRNLETCNLVGQTVVEIVQVTGSDAPVVVSGLFPSFRFRDQDGKTVSSQVMTEIDYRLLGGRLMRRATLDSNLFTTSRHRTLPALAEIPVEGRAALQAALRSSVVLGVDASLAQSAMYLLQFAMARNGAGLMLRKPGGIAAPRGVDLEAETPLARVVSNDRQQRANDMSILMSEGAALVDGELYLPSWGPAWTCDLQDQPPVSLAMAHPEIGLIGRLASNVFSAGQEQTLRVMASRVGVDIEWAGKVDVFDATALPLGTDELPLRSVADDLLSASIVETFLEARRPAGLRACVDLLDAAMDLDADAEGMIPVLRRFVTEWNAIIPKDDPRRWASDRAREVLERVDIRQALELDLDAPRPTR